MNAPSRIAKAALIACVGLFSACQMQTDGNSAATLEPPHITSEQLVGLSPVDVNARAAEYFSTNPNRNEIPLIIEGTKHNGFYISRRDTMYFDGLTSDRVLNIEADIIRMSGNEICANRSGPWMGACLKLFKTQSGKIHLFYRLGNGTTGDYIVKGLRL